MAEGAELVDSNVRQILGVRGMGPDGVGGEYPWRMRFGSQLHRLRHLNVRAASSTEAEISRIYVVQAIETWEPRAFVTVPDVKFGLAKSGGIREIKVTISPEPESSDAEIMDERRPVTLEVEA